MSFEGKLFFDAAAKIMDLPGSAEELSRTAIGRFYYSAFLEARDLAGIRNSRGSVHDEVIDHYSANTKVSNRLEQLKIKRNKADYKTDQTLSERDARDAKRLAKRILEELENYRK